GDTFARTDSLTFGGTPLALHYSAPRAGTAAAATAMLPAGAALALMLAALVRYAIAKRSLPGTHAGDAPPTEARMMAIIR
ncbi:hypothetical protein DN575_30975, partial [Burkholderia multivorans]